MLSVETSYPYGYLARRPISTQTLLRMIVDAEHCHAIGFFTPTRKALFPELLNLVAGGGFVKNAEFSK